MLRVAHIVVGGIVVMTRAIIRRRFIAGVAIGVAISGVHFAHATRIDPTTKRVNTLMHACTPKYTGGGVTQCANPTLMDTAIIACYMNDAYIGGTMEDTFHLMNQCVHDYIDMKVGR